MKEEPVRDLLAQLNSPIENDIPRICIVLAAGHGKRIRSETSKMLHEIWGRPTALRVARAVQQGLDSPNQVIVVGIKGADVAKATRAQSGRIFAYQENPVLGLPAGTGDAVRVGLQYLPEATADRDVYIFLGDMGLLTEAVVLQFRTSFEKVSCDMMVLTGLYSGPAVANYYGRIVRVPATDVDGASSGEDRDKVIEIMEHKDILGLDPETPYQAVYNGRTYAFSQRELLETSEINTGVFAFKEAALRTYIRHIDTDNVQGELMLTDLVQIFNQHQLIVRAAVAESEEEILAINVKSVWHQMQTIARRWAYERLMDTITIADEVILLMDKDIGPLDIVIGKGVHIGPEVRLNRRVNIGDRSHLHGNVVLSENVHIGVGVELSTYQGQSLILGDGVEILSRNIVKGNLRIGAKSRIESGVIMTGSDEHPMRVGERVTVKGISYLYGCQIDDDLLIEHSVIKCKRVEQVRRRDGIIQSVRYVLPQPEGLDSISEL